MKHENKSITRNVILNGIKTLLSIVFPVITYPYITRVLHATNLGKVNFAQSVVSYYGFIAALGIGSYAVREGAKLKEDKKKLNIFCNEVFTINILTTLFACLLLAISMFFVPKFREYDNLICIFSISIIATTVGIDWLNIIYEDFYIITVRSIFTHMVNLVLLFIIVKTENDYYKYAVLLVLPNIILCIWNFFYCKKYLKISLTIKPCFIKHIKPLFVFFANDLAISIYCYADTTMLGWLAGDLCVGIYSVAVKAYTVVKAVLASVYVVCIPRLSTYYGNHDLEKFRKLVNTVLCCLILFLFPMMAGLVLLAEPVVLFLGGVEYIDAIPTLRILSLALVFAIIGGLFSSCINTPMGKESLTLKATLIAAMTNIILNLGMIPLFKQNGAAITTVIAEFAVVAVVFVKNREIKKIINFSELLRNMGQAMVGCVVSVVSYLLSAQITHNSMGQCIITVVLSVSLYAGFLILVKNRYMLMLTNKACKFVKR